MKAIEAPKRAIIASFYVQSFTLIATFLFIKPGTQNYDHLTPKQWNVIILLFVFT